MDLVNTEQGAEYRAVRVRPELPSLAGHDTVGELAVLEYGGDVHGEAGDGLGGPAHPTRHGPGGEEMTTTIRVPEKCMV